MGVTLNDNNAKLDNLERAIKAANERRRKLIEKNKMITYDTLSNLYGKEGQELIDHCGAYAYRKTDRQRYDL